MHDCSLGTILEPRFECINPGCLNKEKNLEDILQHHQQFENYTKIEEFFTS